MKKIINRIKVFITGRYKESGPKIKENQIFKYNEDDILEILTEYMAEEANFKTFGSSAKLLGTPGKDLRAIVVIGQFEDDSIINIDLDSIDKDMEFNGTH